MLKIILKDVKNHGFLDVSGGFSEKPYDQGCSWASEPPMILGAIGLRENFMGKHVFFSFLPLNIGGSG